jgi:hypothetical protein
VSTLTFRVLLLGSLALAFGCSKKAPQAVEKVALEEKKAPQAVEKVEAVEEKPTPQPPVSVRTVKSILQPVRTGKNAEGRSSSVD